MKKRFLCAGMTTLLTVGLLAGCAGSSNGSAGETTAATAESVTQDAQSTPSAKGEELKIWMPPFAASDSAVTDVDFWTQQLQPLVDETGCKLSIEIVPWDNYETKYLTGITSGEGPDIGYMYMEMFSDYIKMGAIAPLDSYFTQDEKDNYIYFDRGNFNNTQYALPIVVGSPRILVANMDILNAAGVTKVPSTLDELVDTAEKISASSDVAPLAQAWGDSHYGTLNEVFWPYFWAEGGSILNEKGEPDLNTEAAVKAAQYLYDLRYKYNILSDSTTSVNSDDALSAFESGKAAMTIMASGDAARLTAEGINWDYTTYLHGEGDSGATFIAADSLVLLNSCKNKELAVKAMKLMTSPSVMEAFHKQVYNAPPISKNETYDDAEVFKELYADNSDHLTTLPVFSGATTLYDSLFKNLQNMMLNDTTPEAVMKDTMDYYNSNVEK